MAKIRDRIKGLRYVKASILRPSPRNWRLHPKAQREALRGVLAEIGYVDALLARELPDGSLELIDGHLRQETTPDQDVPVLVVDLDEAEAAKVLATLDPLTAMAQPDVEALERLLAECQVDDPAVQSMLDNLAAESGLAGDNGEADEDEVPAPPAEPITQPGDLWLLGDHRLLCGDCRKLADIKRLCVEPMAGAFTSPPYAEQRKDRYASVPADEYVDWWEAVQANVRAVLAADGSFFVNIKPHCEGGERVLYVCDLVLAMKRRWGWRFVDELIWVHAGTPGRPARRFKNQFEPILVFALGDWKFTPGNARFVSDGYFSSAGRSSVSQHQGLGGTTLAGITLGPGLVYPGNVIKAQKAEALSHSAAFPVGLPEFAMKGWSDEGSVWLDPFIGSGTTMVAAERLNRRCCGMEIEPAYVDICVKRWENLTGRKAKREA